MQVDHITNTQALLFVGGVIGFALLLYRLIPRGRVEAAPVKYATEEITAYDRELPKYFLVAALSLILGGLHTEVKNLPGFWQWLWQAGYGGHLFRDLSNSHIVIVGGGTVLLTAITWYILPRITQRPLFSQTLAGVSFWFTISGLFGFYLAWLILGLVEGNLVTQGWEYATAKEWIGNWHKIPTALSSSIMGIGYWSYVLNAFLTVFAARRITSRPLAHLSRFVLVAAGALFVGTVQGVVQVMPKNADWIHAAGKFGEYVDPISHAHINLVTGMMVGLAGFYLFFQKRFLEEGSPTRPPGKGTQNVLFWSLAAGSMVFYLTFLLIGLTIGHQVAGWGGINANGWMSWILRNQNGLLSVAGTAMLTGFWVYFFSVWRGLGLFRLLRSGALLDTFRSATPRAFWLASSFALLAGTTHGFLQVIPATAALITIPEEIPNIHAQLNMIGGVLLALIGLVYLLLPELLGQPADRRLIRVSLYGIAGGIGLYYLVTLITGLLRLNGLSQGLSDAEAAARLGWVAPALLFLTALPMFTGYLAFGLALWRVSRSYRAAWTAEMAQLPGRYNGRTNCWHKHIPLAYFLLAELASAAVGFPGLGWLLSGRGVPGIPLILTGPAIAWGVIPILISPYGDGILAGTGVIAPVVYLIASTLLSVLLLWITLRPQKTRTRQNIVKPREVTGD